MVAFDVFLAHVPALLAFIISILSFRYIFIQKADAITETFDENIPTSPNTEAIFELIKNIRSEIMNKETEMESLLRTIGDKDVEVTNKILSELDELESQMGLKSREKTIKQQKKDTSTNDASLTEKSPSNKNIRQSSKTGAIGKKTEPQLVDDGSDSDSYDSSSETMEDDNVVETFVEGIPSASSVKFHKIR